MAHDTLLEDLTHRLNQLKSLFPEVFVNDKLDWQRLQQVLADETQVVFLPSEPPYGLNWAGKTEARLEALKPASSSLLPDFQHSILFDKASHAFIAGENLEVLRLMQVNYREQVKMIYIDPPYNTGNDSFIYADNFAEQKRSYQQRIEKIEKPASSAELDFWKKHLKDNGHFHAAWLSMMYPRLFLACNLLREDGVIFISIDDSEQAHLKLLCDEIFGEENFIANMVRQHKAGSGHDSSAIAIEYDYILVYAKNKSKLKFNQEVVAVEQDPKYRMSDPWEATRGKFYLRDLVYKGSYSVSMDYPIETPDGEVIYAGGKLGEPYTWRWNQKKLAWGIENGFIEFRKKPTGWKVYIKQYQFVDNNDTPRQRTLPYRAMIKFLNGLGSQEIAKLFGDSTFFSFPKSTDLLQYLIKMVCDKEDLILDFFAGSGTTSHAVMALNQADGGHRKSISVQLPAPLEPTHVAYQQGLTTIAAIARERLVRAIGQLYPQDDKSVGLRVFELLDKESNSVKTVSQLQKFYAACLDIISQQGGSLLDEIVLFRPEDKIAYWRNQQTLLCLGQWPTDWEALIFKQLAVQKIILPENTFAENSETFQRLKNQLVKASVLLQTV